MTEKSRVERLGDKDLPFKTCEVCDSKGNLHVIQGRIVCTDCAKNPEDGGDV